MKIKKAFTILLCAVLVFVCIPFSVSAKEEAEYVEGEIVITSRKEIEDNHGMLQTASVSDTVGIDFDDTGITEIGEIETYSEEENVYLAEVDGNVEKICRELNENSDIIAEPNYILHTADFTVPTEISTPLYTKNMKWYFGDVLHIPEAWQTHEVTGSGVTVAVIDDGYCLNALDFPTNLWLNDGGTPGWNTYNDSDDISPIYKRDGTMFSNTAHGSNVAGIIGMPPNGTGGIGAAYGAELMLIQAANYVNESTNPSFTSTAVANAIDFARNNGADIINLSLGSYTNVAVIASAVTRAYNAGILVVAAAGNNGLASSEDEYYPAAMPEVIGVMAIDKTDPSRLSYFSNYDTDSGSFYDIAAPGVSILGCYSSSSYIAFDGTSQAAPLVSGIAALYMEKNPGCTIQKLKSDMLASANDYVNEYSGSQYNYKALNALKFLNYCNPPQINVNYMTDANIYGNYLQGLNEGYADIGNYLSVADGSMILTPSENGNGTGSEIDIYDGNGNLFRTLTVVIFGDVNGDCRIDGQDALLIRCRLSGLNGSELSAAQEYAGDVGNNRILSTDDAETIINYAVKKPDCYIDQIR